MDQALNMSSTFLYPDYSAPFYGYQNLTQGKNLDDFKLNMNQSLELLPANASFGSLLEYHPMAYYKFFDTLMDGLNLTLVVDERQSHVLPIALNDLTNSIASMLGLAEKISVSSHPFKPTSALPAFDGLLFAGAMFLGFTYVIMIISLSLELIYDREIRAKNQLRVNGLGFYLYFASFYTIFLVMIFILCIAILILAQVVF